MCKDEQKKWKDVGDRDGDFMTRSIVPCMQNMKRVLKVENVRDMRDVWSSILSAYPCGISYR